MKTVDKLILKVVRSKIDEQSIKLSILSISNTISCSVSIPKSLVYIIYECNSFDCKDSIKKYINEIQKLGYSVEVMVDLLPDIEISVSGMMCQKSCGSTVMNALNQLNNVECALVKFPENFAHIWGNNVSISDCISSIEMVGYDAVLLKPISSSVDLDIKSNLDSIVDSDGLSPDISFNIINGDRKIFDFIQHYILALDGVVSVEINRELSIGYIWGFVDLHALISELKSKGILIKNSQDISTSNDLSNTDKYPLTSFSQYNDRTLMAEVMISFMNSASCKKLESIISSKEGVIKFNANVLTEKMEIVFNPDLIGFDYVRKLIEDAGYILASPPVIKKLSSVPKREYVLNISGMSCANCALKIEKALSKLIGVTSVSVSSVTDKCRITVDEYIQDSVGMRDIINQVKVLGFDCDLDQENSNAGDSKSADYLMWFRLLIISCIFGLPLTILHFSMLESHRLMMFMKSPCICHGGITLGQTIMFFFSTPIQILVGYRFYRGALIGIANRTLGMDFLVVTGTTITYVYSVVTLFMACRSTVPSEHVFLEASAMLLMFVTIGKFMESYAKGKSSTAIKDLLKLQPQNVLLLNTSKLTNHLEIKANDNRKNLPFGSLSSSQTLNLQNNITENCPVDEIKLELVQKNDILKGIDLVIKFSPLLTFLYIFVVLPGSRIPTDGVVICGGSFVDESIITGESTPVFKNVGDFLFGSTLNQNNLIYMQATSVGSDSALAQIAKLVESSQLNKAPVQAFADELAGVFTPIVLILATLTFAVWSGLCLTHVVPQAWFIDEYGDPILFSMLFGISVVVVSCPCALGLATPTAIMVGTSVGAMNGVLIKGGIVFEISHKINTVIFDKTGTLTEGHPSVSDLEVFEESFDTMFLQMKSSSKDTLLRVAASVEAASEHPLGNAILNAAKAKSLELFPLLPNSFQNLPGNGIEAQIAVGHVLIGNRTFLESQQIFLGSRVDSAMWSLEVQGKTAVCVCLNNKVIGIIGISDSPKKEAIATIRILREMGIDCWMVTGDNITTAEAIAERLDIPKDRILASAMPTAKVFKVQELQSAGNFVAMIGDGINDSPALAKADLGIAIGAGTHVAIEAADMVIVRNNLLDVVVALDLAKHVFNRIKWNFFWACLYNVIAIPFAAGVWYPITHTLLPPQYAGLMMAMSSISVVLSSLSLRLYKRPTFDDLSKGRKQKTNFGRKVFEAAKRNISRLRVSLRDRMKPDYSQLPMEDNDSYNMLINDADISIDDDAFKLELQSQYILNNTRNLKSSIQSYESINERMI